MAIQDKFDSAFTDKLLKKTLITSKKTQTDDTAVANDNTHELTKSNLATLSNSFTSLQNAFNKIYAHTLNVRNLHQYEEKRLSNIKRETNLENKIAPSSSPVLNTGGDGSSLASTAATLDELASSVEKLNDKMKKINLSGNGYSNAPLLGDSVGSSSRSRLARIGGRALGVAGVGLDVYGRYQEGESAGQIATGVGGGLAGAALGAKGGAAAGAAIGAVFGGVGAVPGAAIGGFIGGIGGYFAGSYAGDTAYDALNTRAAGGGVKAGGTYVIGERGPEVLMLGGLSGKVLANGQRGKTPESEKYLTAAADRSSRAAAKVIKGQPPGPTSYSAKFSNYLSSLFSNMPNWLNSIKDHLGAGITGDLGGDFFGGEYSELTAAEVAGSAMGPNRSGSSDWRTDTEFLTELNNVSRKYNINPRAILGLIASESGFDPKVVNDDSGATGLFQFMPAYHNTTRIGQMSRAEQVRYADEQYFSKYTLPAGATAGQIYSIFLAPSIAKRINFDRNTPLYSAGSDEYEANKGLDLDGNNAINIADLDARIVGRVRQYRLPGLTAGISASGFASPIRGALAITDRYGTRGGAHKGLDIGGNTGDPIMAVLGGEVLQAGPSGGDAGTWVRIRHANGMETRYMHLSQVSVTQGQTVAIGQQIGLMGSTGRSTGPHLHLELFINERQVDIEPYLRGAAAATLPPTPNAERISRPTSPGLPAGYREGVSTLNNASTPGVYTPNNTFIPNMAQRAEDVPGYLLMGTESKTQVNNYFRLRRR
jgi:murein DD-endopeptidase MepM/ murein hydrolase activator NlpD